MANSVVKSDPEIFKYDLFISYSHTADQSFATKLQRALHKLGKPWYRRRAMRTFLDTSSLAATDNLPASLETALSESESYLLLASPGAARSKWVNEEVEFWLANKSRNRIIIALTAGTVAWDHGATDFNWSQTDALPPAMRGVFESQPLFIDLRDHAVGDCDETAFRRDVSQIAGAVLGKAPVDLIGEDIRQQRKAMRLALAAVLVLTALLVTSSVLGWISARRGNEIEKQADQLVAANANLQARLVRNLTERAVSEFEFSRYDVGLSLLWKALDSTPKDDPQRPGLQRLLGSWKHWSPVVCHTQNYSLRTAAFDSSGKYLVTSYNPAGQYDAKFLVRVWDTQSGQPFGKRLEHERHVNSLIIDAACTEVITGSQDGIVRVWDLATGKVTRQWVAEEFADISFLAWVDKSRVVTGEWNGAFQVWNKLTGKPIGPKLQNGRQGNVAAVSDNGRYLVTGNRESAIMWDLQTGEQLFELPRVKDEGEIDVIRIVAINSIGDRVFAADSTGRIESWLIANGVPEHVEDEKLSGPASATFIRGKVNVLDIGDLSLQLKDPRRNKSITVGDTAVTGQLSLYDDVAELSPAGKLAVTERPANQRLEFTRTVERSGQPTVAVIWNLRQGERIARMSRLDEIRGFELDSDNLTFFDEETICTVSIAGHVFAKQPAPKGNWPVAVSHTGKIAAISDAAVSLVLTEADWSEPWDTGVKNVQFATFCGTTGQQLVVVSTPQTLRGQSTVSLIDITGKPRHWTGYNLRLGQRV